LRTVAGIIGIGRWDELTLPAYQSVSKWCEAVVMDNASDPPYPFGKRIERTSYAGAINRFIQSEDADWYVILNNDILCHGSVPTHLDPMTLHGKKLRSQNGVEWVDMWILLISRQAYETVGEFDENFKMGGFEDADYCIRAKEHGIGVALADLPFTHLAKGNRWSFPGYDVQRHANIELIKQKHGVNLDSGAKVMKI
jgi:hypothetical protein